MNKKILFIVNVDWFFISHRLPLAIEALKRGYDVHIACGITDKKKYLEELGLNVHSLNLLRSNTGLIYEIKTFIEIFMILKKVKPNIAHFVTIKPVIYGGIASRFFKISNKIFAIPGLGFVFVSKKLKVRFMSIFIKFVYKFALVGNNSYVIVQNNHDKDFILKLNVPKKNVFLIKGSGVNLDEYFFEQKNNNTLKVVMASRLLKEKGVFEYVGAIKLINNKKLNVKFELYGNIDVGNPNSITENDLLEIEKVPNLEFKGFCNNIKQVLKTTDILVLPSYYGEGLPKILIEAAACGVPTITTDMPGCRDAIEPNVTGLLCNVKDPVSLADKIEILIKDEELRNKMGKAGRVLAEKEFDINKVVSKHFEIYEK